MDETSEELLALIKSAAENDRENNRQVMENHLAQSAIVISNIAALRTLDSTSQAALLEAAAKNPT